MGELEKTISVPREDYKEHVPRIESIQIPEDAIGGVIGKGGETIQEMQADTNSTISIDDPIDGSRFEALFAEGLHGGQGNIASLAIFIDGTGGHERTSE